MNNIILDLFLYFAKFPEQSGVLSLFNKGRSDTAMYSELKDKVTNLPIHSLNSSIQHYAFGVAFEAIQRRVSQLTGTYLFVDFGEIESQKPALTRQDSLSVAITVATKLSDYTGDLIEQTCASQTCLNQIVEIRNIMIKEQRERYFLKNISSSQTIVPFASKELSSLGWTIIFTTDGVDMLK